MPAHPVDGPTLLRRMYRSQETSSAEAHTGKASKEVSTASSEVDMLDTAASLVRVIRDPSTPADAAQAAQRSLDIVVATYQQASSVWLS